MAATTIIAVLYMVSVGIEHPLLGPPEVRLWLVLRGVTGTMSVYSLYLALHWLELGDALSVCFTTPLISELSPTLQPSELR